MTRRVRNYGGTIVEIPIIFEEREAGRSKMSRRIVLEAVLSIAAWGLKDRVLTPGQEISVEGLTLQ